MALISQFYGILIHLQFMDHNPPHFHAYYAGSHESFTLDGELYQTKRGSIPAKKKALIKAWAILREEELNAVWQLSQEGGQVFKIEGLK